MIGRLLASIAGERDLSSSGRVQGELCIEFPIAANSSSEVRPPRRDQRVERLQEQLFHGRPVVGRSPQVDLPEIGEGDP